MNPETHASLQDLEKELERLRSAVEHIDQAKAVSQKVVGAVALIQKKYGEHLDALLESQKHAAEKLGKGTEQRFEEISGSARRHILESAARAKKYLEDYSRQMREALDSAGSIAGDHVEEIAGHAADVVRKAGAQLQELTDQSSQLLESFSSSSEEQIVRSGKQIEDRVRELLGQLREDFDELQRSAAQSVQKAGGAAAQHVTEITDRARAAVESMDASTRQNVEEISTQARTALEKLERSVKGHIEEIGVLAQGGVKETAALARTAVEDAGNQSKRIFAAIKKAHDQHITDFEKVTVSSDALIAASGKLVRTIDAVDFPSRLQSIENDIRSLHYNFNSSMSRLDALEKSTEAAMEAMGGEMVGKIGRVEAFTDKTIRTLSDGVEKRFEEQQKTLSATRIIVVLLLLLNLLMAGGIYMLWSGSEPSQPEKEPALMETVDSLATPDGEESP